MTFCFFWHYSEEGNEDLKVQCVSTPFFCTLCIAIKNISMKIDYYFPGTSIIMYISMKINCYSPRSSGIQSLLDLTTGNFSLLKTNEKTEIAPSSLNWYYLSDCILNNKHQKPQNQKLKEEPQNDQKDRRSTKLSEVEFVTPVTHGGSVKFASGVNFSRNNAVCYINESKKLHFILISSLKLLTYYQLAHL